MHIPLPFHEKTATDAVSTGRLPDVDVVETLLTEVYDTYRSIDEGTVADYIPALANADPDLFGLCIVGVRGRSFAAGSAQHEFSLQSISKAFVFALVCDELGHDTARQKLGVNATGLAFNSVMAIELNQERTMNPMVNAGAMATTSLVPGNSPDEQWTFILEGLSALRRSSTGARPGGLPLGVPHQSAQPGDCPPPRELRAPVLGPR